jgi:type IV pilus assembly protein PilA
MTPGAAERRQPKVLTLKGLARRRGDDEEGFTLIELMVVVLIIAILIAIAIPTFLGARQRAQDRAAQSDLRNGLTAEKTYYTDAQAYVDNSTAANVTTLKNIESALVWDRTSTSFRVMTVVTDVSSVGVATAPDIVCLQEKSRSGTTFSIADIASGPKAGTYYGKAACPASGAGEAGFSAIGVSW